MADDLRIANSKIQENLEIAILKYQKSLLTNNKSMIDRSYKDICKFRFSNIVLWTTPSNWARPY